KHTVGAGMEKKVFWHQGKVMQRPIALVYLHGYSATRQEISPVCEQLAAKIGANIYFARLTGHGNGAEFLAQAKASDWQQDAVQSYQLGKLIGKQVILIGYSTGATLAAWLAAQGCYDIAAYIMLSPNFGLRDRRAELFRFSFLYPLLYLLVGKEHKTPVINAKHNRYWTTTYPLVSLAEMLKLVREVRTSKVCINQPLLLAYCPDDKVLSTRAMDSFFAQAATKQKYKIIFPNCGDPQSHVLAGDILSPANNQRLLASMAAFINAVGRQKT
ncbi:MAG: alpha/beta fold hydrolase, partial [Pseudomonadota bacterium]|nr:alpha/beta fold hydrolase [Pseudomonadota bacterium]